MTRARQTVQIHLDVAELTQALKRLQDRLKPRVDELLRQAAEIAVEASEAGRAARADGDTGRFRRSIPDGPLCGPGCWWCDPLREPPPVSSGERIGQILDAYEWPGPPIEYVNIPPADNHSPELTVDADGRVSVSRPWRIAASGRVADVRDLLVTPAELDRLEQERLAEHRAARDLDVAGMERAAGPWTWDGVTWRGPEGQIFDILDWGLVPFLAWGSEGQRLAAERWKTARWLAEQEHAPGPRRFCNNLERELTLRHHCARALAARARAARGIEPEGGTQ